tara:strand:- start:85 stop:252 length:168 start_codon:yes stop_codon:yes gene_type:complete
MPIINKETIEKNVIKFMDLQLTHARYLTKVAINKNVKHNSIINILTHVILLEKDY